MKLGSLGLAATLSVVSVTTCSSASAAYTGSQDAALTPLEEGLRAPVGLTAGKTLKRVTTLP